jgi:transcription elongation factor Elf1
MKPLLLNRDQPRLFPCPVCGDAREVRTTKKGKGKPYIICDLCGVQMFVRVETGIRRLEALVKDAADNNMWKRLADLERSYRFECPKCGKKFWLTKELIATSWVSGKLEGYRCPDPQCGGIVKEEKAA